MRRANNAIRAVALLSPDKTAQEALLLAIGEPPEDARERYSILKLEYRIRVRSFSIRNGVNVQH